MLQGYDNATDVILGGRYIRVMQGLCAASNGSEGDYVITGRCMPIEPTPIDDATDTYDTQIDWLVKNVSESNGKVGTLGHFLRRLQPLMALVNRIPR